MSFARKLLYPFSLLYGGVTAVRNTLYDKDILKSHSYDLPVICVGNLSVGGTGKSPMVEYLISLLQEDLQVATLSRGYKRITSGFVLLTGAEHAAEAGDEPLQFKTKFPQVQVAVDESRSHGIDQLLQLNTPPDVIILDDAFQHRKVSAGLNILLTPYNSLYTKDLILPAGSLREPISGAGRAHFVVVTKCPAALSDNEKKGIGKKLDLRDDQELFFTTVAYSATAGSVTGQKELDSFKGEKFTLVTGIANPAPLVDHLKEQGLTFQHFAYPDHHNFSRSELKELENQPLILTTEKDYMRLKDKIAPGRLFYLPIKTSFLEQEERFRKLITDFAKKK